MSENRFNLRGFISLISFFSFAILLVTGVVLYLVPQGRVANWTNWELLGLTKDGWAGLHTIFALTFIIAGIWHIVLNWKAIWRYLVERKRTTAWPLAAALLTVVFLAGTVLLLPPFNYVIDLGAALKDSWIIEKAYDPPFGHAEESSLKTFCSRMNIDVKQAEAALREAGIEFEGPSQTLAEIAAANGISAMDLYAIFEGRQQAVEPEDSVAFTEEEIERRFTGVGMGKETLATAAQRIGVDLDYARAKLAARGIELGEDEKLRDAAARLETEMIQILKYILLD